jgi:hypothetical protein
MRGTASSPLGRQHRLGALPPRRPDQHRDSLKKIKSGKSGGCSYVGMAPEARPPRLAAEKYPRGSVFGRPPVSLGSSSKSRTTTPPFLDRAESSPLANGQTEEEPSCPGRPGRRPDHGLQYGQYWPCRYFSNDFNLAGRMTLRRGRLEPPEPGPPRSARAPNRLGNLAQDSPDRIPMQRRDRLLRARGIERA